MSRVIHILKPGLHLLLNLAWLVCCSLVVLAADIRFKARPGQLVRFCRLCVLHTNRQTCIWLPCLMSRDQRHLTASFKELPLLNSAKHDRQPTLGRIGISGRARQGENGRDRRETSFLPGTWLSRSCWCILLWL